MQDDDDFRVVTDPDEIAAFEAEEAACRERWEKKHGRPYEELQVEPEPVPTKFSKEELEQWQKIFRRTKKS